MILQLHINKFYFLREFKKSKNLKQKKEAFKTVFCWQHIASKKKILIILIIFKTNKNR